MISRKAKTSIFVLIILIVLSLSLAGGLFYFLQKEHVLNLGLQRQIEEITNKQKVTEENLEKSKRQISDFEVKIRDAQSQLEALNVELQTEKTAKQEALAEAERLKLEMETQKKIKSVLEEQLNQAQSEAKGFQDRLANLEASKSELEKKLKDLESKATGVELGTIVVGSEKDKSTLPLQEKPVKTKKKKEAPQKETVKKENKSIPPVQPTATKLEGSILVINKDYNFAVIDLGSNEGVSVGTVFSIYDNGTYIGDVRVEKVHDSMSAAGFISENIKDKISEGNKALEKK